MAGRPPKAQELNTNHDVMDIEVHDGKPKVEYFDKYLISVKREPAPNGKYSICKSINVMALQRGHMAIGALLADALNSKVEHRNNTEMGFPVVEWYFPEGSVKQGETYRAFDKYAEYEDEETGKIIRALDHSGSPIVLRMIVTDEIHTGTNEKGKPVYSKK